METIYVAPNQRISEENVVHLEIEVLFNFSKQCLLEICPQMEGSRKKSESEPRFRKTNLVCTHVQVNINCKVILTHATAFR